MATKKITVTLLFSRPYGFISYLVSLFTASLYSHSDLVLYPANFSGKTRVVGSWPFSGVEEREYDVEGLKAYKLVSVDVPSQKVKKQIEKYIKDRIGCKYDWTAIFSFIRGRVNFKESKNKYFCSELIAEAFESAGISLVSGDVHRITPGMLSVSPLCSVKDQFPVE